MGGSSLRLHLQVESQLVCVTRKSTNLIYGRSHLIKSWDISLWDSLSLSLVDLIERRSTSDICSYGCRFHNYRYTDLSQNTEKILCTSVSKC